MKPGKTTWKWSIDVSRYLLNTRNPSVILMVALVLAACSGLTQSDKPALNVWWLQPVSGAPAADTVAAPSTLVLELDVVPGLDTDKVLALSSDAQLKPYAGARWAEALPELAASLFTRSLESTGRFGVLRRGRAGAAAADCELRLEVDQFFADLAADGRTRGVSVGITGEYRCKAAESRGLEARAYVDVGEERMSAIVAAFQKALDKVTLDLIKEINIKQ